MSYIIIFFQTVFVVVYVFGYMIVQHPFLRLWNVDTYFVNDSTFIFIPGNNPLSVGLTISGVHNISITLFKNNVTIDLLYQSVFSDCEKFMNISIANIIFDIGGNFTGLLLFTAIYFVKI